MYSYKKKYHPEKLSIFKQCCEEASINVLHYGLLFELRKMYKGKLHFPPTCFLFLVCCVLLLPLSIMYLGHVYHHSGYLFVSVTKAEQITARYSEHTSAEFQRQLSLLVTHSSAPAHTHRHTHARITRHLIVLPLHLPPWRDPFSEWKTCLDVSEIYISAHTQGASLLRLKEVKGGKKEMNFKVYRHVLSQYPALWPCLIYEAASFIFSPVVYQPHETSTRTSFLTTYTEMFTLAPPYTRTHFRLPTVIITIQACLMNNIANKWGKKGTNVWVIGI